jgi:hypothetical protein
MLLIMIIIFSGAVITITVSLTDAFAFSDKIDQKLIQQKDDNNNNNNNNNNNQKNYQQLYKQYDFEKYLNYHYMYIPQYNDNRDSNSNDDTSKKNPFAAAAIDNNNFNDKKDNNKQSEQQSNSEKDEDKAEYILELNDRKDFADHKKYSSDKDDKKTYKNIKIVECKNFNINAYEIEDLKSIETLLTKPTTFENNDDDDDNTVGNQQVKSHNEKSSKEAKEYDINSNTKVIFICNNENHEIRPINSNNLTQPLTNDGILLPTHSPNNHNNNNNNNNNGENKPITTTISYAQYKKSISND